MAVRRRGLGVICVLFCAVALSGCSPSRAHGVRMGDDGIPRVVSCGAWITSVDVSDARSGRSLWSARATSSDGYGESSVDVGSLPNFDWVATGPPEPARHPKTWRFVIGLGDHKDVIVVTDSQFAVGRVFVPGRNQSVSAGHFDNETCNGFPISASALRVLALVALLGGFALFGVIVSAVKRERRRVPPTGWYPDPAGMHRLRYWSREWTPWVADGDHAFREGA
jgi:hypothetical protein